jgi:hypothetical protein
VNAVGRLTSLALVAIVATIAAACSCPGTTVLVDDFEGCTGTCGWTVNGGTASVVSTILPGEHGLELSGGAKASKSIMPVTIDGTYSFQLVASCPAGLGATLSASTPSDPAIKLTVMLSINDTLDSSGNSPSYCGVTYVPLTGYITLPSGVMSAVVNGVTLLPTKGEPCTVDLIEITSIPPCSCS